MGISLAGSLREKVESTRSPLYRWLKKNRAEVAEEVAANVRPPWGKIAAWIADAGVHSIKEGKDDSRPPSPEAVAKCWTRLLKDEERRKAARDKAAVSRRRGKIDQQPHPAVRSIAAAPAREAPARQTPSDAQPAVRPAPVTCSDTSPIVEPRSRFNLRPPTQRKPKGT